MRHDMRDVELVEGDDAPGTVHLGVPVQPAWDGVRARAQGPSGPSPGPSRAPAVRRRLLSVAVLLLAAVVAVDVSAQARARATLAALADVPGVLAPIGGPVVELWRADPMLRPELMEAAGLLVGVMAAHGQADVVALDPATGSVVWRAAARRPDAGEARGGVRCVVAHRGSGAAPAGDSVACVVDGGAPGAVLDRLLVLDATSGTLLHEQPVAPSTALATIDGDLVVGHVDPGGHVRVVRTHPLGEQRRWEFVSPRPLRETHPGWAARVGVVRDRVVVDEVDGWVLDADGTVLHSWNDHGGISLEGSVQVLGDGRYVARPREQGGAAPRIEVSDLDRGRSFSVPGRAVQAWPDDGTLAGWVLARPLRSHDVIAHDPGTGEAAWRAPGSTQGRTVVVDGRLVTFGWQGLTSVDGRTGDVLWTTDVLRTARASLVTDGRLALVTELDGDRGITLGAYGLDDGRRRWRADLGDDVAVLTVLAGRLFGWTGEQLVALGAPPEPSGAPAQAARSAGGS